MANPIVTFEMENGDIMKAELYPEIAPNTVNNFVSLVQKGFYDGLRKFNIILILTDFLICHSVYLPNIQFSRYKSISFCPSFLRCVPLLYFPPHFRRDFTYELP